MRNRRLLVGEQSNFQSTGLRRELRKSGKRTAKIIHNLGAWEIYYRFTVIPALLKPNAWVAGDDRLRRSVVVVDSCRVASNLKSPGATLKPRWENALNTRNTIRGIYELDRVTSLQFNFRLIVIWRLCS